MTEEKKDDAVQWVTLSGPSDEAVESAEHAAMRDAAPGVDRLDHCTPLLESKDKGIRALASFYASKACAELAESAWFPARWRWQERKHLRKALEDYPYWGFVAGNLSFALIGEGKHREARTLLRESLAAMKQELAGGKRLNKNAARTVAILYRNWTAAHSREHDGRGWSRQWARIQAGETEVAYLEEAIELLEKIDNVTVLAECQAFREWRDRTQAYIKACKCEYDAWLARGCQ